MTVFGIDFDQPQWFALGLLLKFIVCLGMLAGLGGLGAGIYFGSKYFLKYGLKPLGKGLLWILTFLCYCIYQVITKVLILPVVFFLVWITVTFKIRWDWVAMAAFMVCGVSAPSAFLYWVIKPEYFNPLIQGSLITGLVLGVVVAPFVTKVTWGQGVRQTVAYTAAVPAVGAWGATAFVAFYALCTLMGD